MKTFLNILNLLNALILVLFVLWMFDFISLFPGFSMFHLLVIVLAIYGLKTFIEIKFDIHDPIKENRIARVSYYLGTAALCIGIMFRIMHWPLAGILILIGALGVLFSSVIRLILPADETSKLRNDEILDDL